MIVLDTHVLVWLAEGSARLGEKSLFHIDKALKMDELFVSVISFWEVAMLIEKRRLVLKMSVNLWRKNLIDNGLKEVGLTGDMAIYAASLRHFHGDPADRMIVAAANNLTAMLCTADEKILGSDLSLMRMDARK